MLTPLTFNQSLLKRVQSFDCGDSYYSQWIADVHQGALRNMEEYKNTVWIYESGDDVVGYGSLGQIRWPFPPPNGPKEQVSYIPMLAVASAFQGQSDGNGRYADQIVEHLISEARSSAFTRLCLMALDTNVGALRLYKRNGFVDPQWSPHQTSIGNFRRLVMTL